jgi:hypothetical protein
MNAEDAELLAALHDLASQDLINPMLPGKLFGV